MLAIDALPCAALAALLPACSRAPGLVRTESAAGGIAATWTYEVAASRGGEELTVDVSIPAGPAVELTLDEEARAFVRDIEARVGSWTLPARVEDTRLRYRFLLAKAADESGEIAVARRVGGAIEAPPSTWLLRPEEAPLGTRLRFHVTSAPGEAFVTGIFPVAEAADTYEFDASVPGRLPYSAFGDVRVRELDDVGIVAGVLSGEFAQEADVLDWIRTSARAVDGYYGRRPIRRLAVLLRPARGSRVGFGTTMGGGGASIAIDVGANATRRTLRDDWVLVHEMTHVALPDLAGPQHWFEEGLATYIEPVARAQAGILAPERLWSEWVNQMPKGLPEKGDQGLDHTHTWGRTYWGGALFCFVADLEIRERTGGRKSLRDGVRGVLEAGGDITVHWPIERVIAAADAATGVPVLRETYDRMKDAPVDIDLDAIWKRLGVVSRGRSVELDDSAPLAALRRAWAEPAPR
jgi:hypothetical protein